MTKLNEHHRYSQQADKSTLFLFYFTSLLIIVVLILASIFKNWWLLVVIPAVVVFWGVYSFMRPTVPVFDLTSNQMLTVNNKEWGQFQKKFPQQVGKKGEL